MAKALATLSGDALRSAADNLFEGIAAQDAAVELSGQLNALAVALMKIANDLRWMNSGPLAGLGEIELPALQPGSSIMPGKVNPVIPEATCMVCAQVIGNHATITFAGAERQLPAQRDAAGDRARTCCSRSTCWRTRCACSPTRRSPASRCARTRLDEALARNPILVTALNPVIGYEAAAKIAKRAYAERRPVLDVALEMSGLPAARTCEAAGSGGADEGRHRQRRREAAAEPRIKRKAPA